MKLKQILVAVVAILAGVAVTACGSKSEEKTVDTREQNNQLTAALEARDMTQVAAIADSMSMYIDELSPDEAVTVLMAYLEIHNNSSRAGNHNKDLETLRKFVDVYDIASTVNPNDFKAAVAHAKSINPAVDLAQIVTDFRDRLAEYDAAAGVQYTAESEETTTKTDSTTVSTEQESAAVVAPEEIETE